MQCTQPSLHVLNSQRRLAAYCVYPGVSQEWRNNVETIAEYGGFVGCNT
jgi:hypothetical protein